MSEPDEPITISGSGLSSNGGDKQKNQNVNIDYYQQQDGERAKLEAKIEKIRDKLTRDSIARAHDVEEFLKLTSGPIESPQIARIKHHFEKKNKKHTQGTERLQKKLDDYEGRLAELDSTDATTAGDLSVSSFNRSSSGRFLHSVGHGIRRTGANMVNAPLGIAQKMRWNVFGSAEELRHRGSSPAGGSTKFFGKSAFYDTDAETATVQSSVGTRNEREPSRSSAFPSSPQNPLSVPHQSTSSAQQQQQQQSVVEIEFNGGGDLSPLKEEGMAGGVGSELEQNYRALRRAYATLHRNYETFKKETETELRSQENEIVNGRFRIQQLEQTINEAMELHLNEIRQLKDDLNMIGVRMDYQYNDRFKKIEESIESAENKVLRIEASWRESAAELERRRSPWNSLMFSGANILVELLKIALYLMAVTLDSMKTCLNSLGFSGTRKRAGIVLIVGIVLFLFWGHIQGFMLAIFSSSSSS